MFIEEEFLDDYGLRRKKFTYNRRVHHSYVFVAGHEVYSVIFGRLADEQSFNRTGYTMPEGRLFPGNGMDEVYFDVVSGNDVSGDFRHVRFKGLGSAVVLQTVALALIAHFETFDVGGFVFQAAAGGVVDIGRSTTLEETYDYLLGLKTGRRYNSVTGLLKKTPRTLIPAEMKAFKMVTEGRANYVILQQ